MKAVRRIVSGVKRRIGAPKTPATSIDDPDLRVVVVAFDDSEAASAVLSRAESWRPELPAVLRHHLVLPPSQVESACRLLEPDGWVLRPGGHGLELEKSEVTPVVGMVALRVQRLDALHCSQESSRMAGLAQRLRGRSLGWDALQPEHS